MEKIKTNCEEVCEYCLGFGEVGTMERVYPNEPHMAAIGSEICICQLQEPDYDNQEEDYHV